MAIDKVFNVGLQVDAFQCPASEAHNVAQETSSIAEAPGLGRVRYAATRVTTTPEWPLICS